MHQLEEPMPQTPHALEESVEHAINAGDTVAIGLRHSEQQARALEARAATIRQRSGTTWRTALGEAGVALMAFAEAEEVDQRTPLGYVLDFHNLRNTFAGQQISTREFDAIDGSFTRMQPGEPLVVPSQAGRLSGIIQTEPTIRFGGNPNPAEIDARVEFTLLPLDVNSGVEQVEIHERPFALAKFVVGSEAVQSYFDSVELGKGDFRMARTMLRSDLHHMLGLGKAFNERGFEFDVTNLEKQASAEDETRSANAERDNLLMRGARVPR